MLERFANWWTRPPRTGAGTRESGPRATYVALILTLLGICALVAWVGVPRMRVFGHDVFIALDGAWRVLHGQRPVVDFYAQMGPVYYLLHAAGLRLAGNDAGGLGYGTTFMAAAIAAWAFLLLRSRMVASVFFLTSIALVLLAAAPFPLAANPWNSSFEGNYNRYGYTLVALVLLECFLPERAAESRAARFTGGFSSGLACAVAFFLKSSFGLVGLGLCAVSVLFRPRKALRASAIAAGVACFALPMLAYLRFDIHALLNEYRQLAAVRGADLGLMSVLHRLFDDRLEISLAPLLTALVSFLPGVSLRRRIELLLAALLTSGAGVLLALTNTPPSLYPLNMAMALIAMNEVCRLRMDGSFRISPLAAAPLFAFGALLVAIPSFLDASGLLLSAGDKLFRPHRGYRIEGPRLAGIEFFDVHRVDPRSEDRNDNGHLFVDYTNEGLHLLRAYSRPEESVRGMGMSNPFSYALSRPPSRGGTPVMSSTDVGQSAVAPLDRIVGDADLLLLPKFPATERDTLQIVLHRYPELLDSMYSPVAESENWKLYRRVRVN